MNPFSEMENRLHARVLAHAFSASHDMQGVYAALRFHRRVRPEWPNLGSYLDGCHFEPFDFEFEQEDAFLTLIELADQFLETNGHV